MRCQGGFAVLLGAGLLLAAPQAARAQGGVLTAAFALGARAKLDSLDPHSRGKFEEYREVPTGPFLQALRLHYAPGDGYRSYTAVVRELAERDQSAWAGGSEPGRWTALLRWDRVPHTFSSTARMLGKESPRFHAAQSPSRHRQLEQGRLPRPDPDPLGSGAGLAGCDANSALGPESGVHLAQQDRWTSHGDGVRLAGQQLPRDH